MIPAAYAAKFAALGMTVEDDIIAVTSSHIPMPLTWPVWGEGGVSRAR